MSRNYGPPGSQCFLCERSTAPRMGGRQPRQQLCSYELSETYMAENPHVLAYARHLQRGDQIDPISRICRPCVQRASRFYTREQDRLAVEQEAVELLFQPPPEESADGPASDPLRDEIEAIPQEVPLEAPDDVQMGAPEADQRDDVDNLQSASPDLQVPVPGYSRVSSSTTYCLVAGCNLRDNLHRIKQTVRAHILRKDSIYIPEQARVCDEHLNAGLIWQDFPDHTRPRHDLFTPVQLANMMLLLKKPVEH
ncbi:uncharacterized protein LOC123693205 [Colias croceus]|uniref:uncharacterized protein LOC123693205 n=1 Tax=Colias crocea TaxID=72248 RepID=UPI001E27D7E4|nr:uncharacterized protein LOC123693205 [Colias croceus]